jgi:hypothetical protein
LYSGQTLPKGKWQASGAAVGNMPTQTTSTLFDGVEPLIDQLDFDTLTGLTTEDMDRLVGALLMHSLDPLGMTYEFGVDYGLLDRWQAGYAYSSGTHAIHLQTQWLGPSSGDSGASTDAWRGSVAVQASQSSYEMPSVLGLDKLQKILKYEFKRRDVLIPLAFGKPLGADGRYGSFATGLGFGMAWVEYGTEYLKVIQKLDAGSADAFQDLHESFSFPYYGGFFNARLGYGHAFLVSGLSVYWQDYGDFELFGSQTHFQGWTFLPSLGLQLTW